MEGGGLLPPSITAPWQPAHCGGSKPPPYTVDQNKTVFKIVIAFVAGILLIIQHLPKCAVLLFLLVIKPLGGSN